MNQKYQKLIELLNSSEVEADGGAYTIRTYDSDEEVQITIEYTRTIREEGFHLSESPTVVFNETYPRKKFSIEKVVEDLHDQNLEEVEVWLWERYQQFKIGNLSEI